MIQKMIRCFVTLFIFNLFSFSAHAQSGAAVWICVVVTPIGEQPYVLEFRNTNIVGMIVPQQSTVIVFGNVDVATYGYTTDNSNGNYIFPSTTPSQTGNASIQSRALLSEETMAGCTTLTSETLATRSVTINPLDAFVITRVGFANYNLNNLLGVVSFYFAPPAPAFQLIQMSDINLSVRFMSLVEEVTDYTIIANKPIEVSNLFTIEVPSNSVEEVRYIQPTYIYDYFIYTLDDLNDVVTLMNDVVRVYPNSGRESQYYQGDILSIDFLTTNPPEPRFEPPCNAIVPLIGAGESFEFLVPDTNQLSYLSSAGYVGFDTMGNLLVTVGAGNRIVTRPWLVRCQS